MDETLLERRIADWKRSEQAAREAEKTAAATLEDGEDKPLAQKAARLRRIADVILQSIMEDMRANRARFSLLDSAAGAPSDLRAS